MALHHLTHIPLAQRLDNSTLTLEPYSVILLAIILHCLPDLDFRTT